MSTEPLPARSQLTRRTSTLFFARTAISGIWVTAVLITGGVSAGTDPPHLLLTILMATYPATDVAATIMDLRTRPHGGGAAAQRINTATSTAAVVLVVVAARSGFTAVVMAFGLWGIVSGAGSILAGITFLSWTGTTHAGLNTLAQYSTGGAIWYLLCATWLRWSARHRTVNA